MELTRKQIIDNLSYIADSMPDDACGEWRDSLAYAISSLKTDEAYQLMYEGGEIFTKADLVAMLTDLYKKIRSYCDDLYSWGEQPSSTIILDIVQKEIDIFTEGST